MRDGLKSLSVQAYIEDIVPGCCPIRRCYRRYFFHAAICTRVGSEDIPIQLNWDVAHGDVFAFALCIPVEAGSNWLRHYSRPTSPPSPLRAAGHPMWQNFSDGDTAMGSPLSWGALKMFSLFSPASLRVLKFVTMKDRVLGSTSATNFGTGRIELSLK